MRMMIARCNKPTLPWHAHVHSGQGGNILFAIAAILITLMVSSLGIDFGTYFVAQTQLQNALDAGALAGAMQLPAGSAAAKAAALDIATKNEVAGKFLSAKDIQFTNSQSALQLSAQVPMMPIMATLFCPNHVCAPMQLAAISHSITAARDTMLVIDTSSSMDDLGGGRPMSDIKKAANAYLDLLVSLNNQSIDRVGLVTFDQSGKLQLTLTSQKDSPNFATLRSKINGMTLFNGTGWNTNYEAGLTVAQTELTTKGRANSDKSIIFMTDGLPNLPAPASYVAYSKYEPYTKCTDIVEKSAGVQALCTRDSKGNKVCPTLPSPKITPNLISAAATACAQTYVDYMSDSISNHDTASKNIGMKANTITLADPSVPDSAQQILRALLKDPTWTPDLLQQMAGKDGQQYAAKNYEADKILADYQKIAQDIRVKLTN